MGSPLRVLIADDHPVVRRGLRALLDTLEGIEVVGEAADGAAAVRETQLTRPDVVLMDVRMPGVDGVEATRRIRSAVPDTAVLMLTMYDDDATVLTAMRAGARGYLLKEAEQEDILAAIRAVASGQAVFGPSIAARMLSLFADPSPSPSAGGSSVGGTSVEVSHEVSNPSGEPPPHLTTREQDILNLLATGKRTAEIAETLFLSPKTVSNHLTSIFAKLQVTDRVAAVVRAREQGFGRPRPGAP